MKKLFTILTAVGLFAFGTATNAALLTYTLTDSNEDVMDGTVWAVVQIQDSGIAANGDDLGVTGDVQITVQTTSAFTDQLTNFGMQAFSFNYDMNAIGADGYYIAGADALDATNIAITDIDPTDWVVTDKKGSNSVFGKFDIDLVGDGSSRTDVLSFLVTGVEDDNAFNYAVAFSTHIADFGGYEDFTSAWFGGVDATDRGLTPPSVPIPPAVWLFGSGLIGLVGVARRKDPVNV